VQGGRAIAILAALIGGIDRPGTMMNPERRGNASLATTPDDTAAKTLSQPRFDELSRYPLGHSSGVYTQTFENLAEGKGPYQPKAGIIVFQNVMMSVPGTTTVAKALAKLELLVVVDTMMSETAMMADIVLPGTTFFERYDLNTHWVTWSVVGLRQPVVKPIFGQLAEYEMVAALGRRLNLKDKDAKEYFRLGALSGQPIEDLTAWYEDYLSAELKRGGPAMTLQELKALPGAVWVDKGGTKYEKYATPLTEAVLRTAVFDGPATAEGTIVYDKAKDQGGRPIGVIVGGKPVRGFNTPSRKVELMAKSLASRKDATGKAVEPLPVYTPRDWQPTPEYPLYQINWKEASHTHSRTHNNPMLLEIKPMAPLIMHPDTAAKYGIADHDNVWVESPYGKVKAQVQISRRMHPEVVGLQHGFGHTALGRYARNRGTSDTNLRPTKSDPLSGQALHKESCVKVYKA
jgi:thiosulfate reductase/polysulfide reductase chain A